MLANKHVSWKLRLKFFNAVVTPAMLFCLHMLALTKGQLESINVLHRKMLRSIVGWVRLNGEDWSETMRRMNHRLSVALDLFPIPPWTEQLAKRQFFCCQDSIGAILVINCWTLDLHNWQAGELWQYAVSQAWTSTGKMGWQTVAHHKSIFDKAADGDQVGDCYLCHCTLLTSHWWARCCAKWHGPVAKWPQLKTATVDGSWR